MALKTFLLEPPRPLPDGRVLFNVVYVDEQAGIKRPVEVFVNGATVEQAKTLLRHERDKAKPADDLVKAFVPGELDLTPAVEPVPDPPNPPDPPTPEQIAKQKYGDAVQKYRQFTGAAKVGVDVAAPLAAVTKQLIDTYIDGYEIFFAFVV